MKDPKKLNKYAELLISMSTDFLMKNITKETFLSNLSAIVKKIKEEENETA